MSRSLAVRRESFPIRGGFRISRGVKTTAEVVVAEMRDGDAFGHGECVPYARYGESVEGVAAAIAERAVDIADGLDRAALQALMPPGAARNALDCALWDLEAKITGVPAWKLAGLEAPPRPVRTLFTIAIAEPAAMEEAARAASALPLIKVKLGGDRALERLRAVRRGAPDARLVVDFNEGSSVEALRAIGPEFAALGVELIEQPIPAGQDEALAGLDCPVPLGADESFHGLGDIARLRPCYATVNIKLDKTGGLTAALAIKRAAEAAGLGIMVGCMLGTSLAMAPATLLAQDAAFVDLDGPLLLERDRSPGLRYDGTLLSPPEPRLWG